MVDDVEDAIVSGLEDSLPLLTGPRGLTKSNLPAFTSDSSVALPKLGGAVSSPEGRILGGV